MEVSFLSFPFHRKRVSCATVFKRLTDSSATPPSDPKLHQKTVSLSSSRFRHAMGAQSFEPRRFFGLAPAALVSRLDSSADRDLTLPPLRSRFATLKSPSPSGT
jgi:hypothetical protein